MPLESDKHDSETDGLIKYLKEHMCFYEKSGYYMAAEKFLAPSNFREMAERIRTMEVYDDDTWILTYPRSGTTWSREMIWLIANDLDFKAAETDLYLRFPLLELGCLSLAHERVFREAWHESTDNVIGDSIDFVKKMPKPRFIWSHLPLELLPTQITEKKSKIITVRREPKDAATSFYHLHRIVEGYKGTADKFFEAFREGLVFIGGCYWHHFASIRKLRSQPNFLSYTYEEMIKDLPSIMRKIASVYNKELTDEEIRELSAHLNITNMKTNKALNSKLFTDALQSMHKRPISDADFIRKGIIGDHNNYMSEETIRIFDEWNRKMKIKLNLTDSEDCIY